MEWTDFTKSALGAVVGFALAQLVNLASVIRAWWRRPLLGIEPMDYILSHNTMIDGGVFQDEVIYGFNVRNDGKTVATGVQFQILHIRHRGPNDAEWHSLKDMALPLRTYAGDDLKGRDSITLVPAAAATIELARWMEGHNSVTPSAPGLFEYYDESVSGSNEFQFEVVAFADGGYFKTSTVVVDRRKKKRPEYGARVAAERLLS